MDKLELLIVVLLVTRASASLASPNYTLYHRSESVLEEVNALASRHPSIMTIQRRKLVVQSGYATEITIVTIGRNSNIFDGKIRVLLNFGQHGRELITTEVALRLLTILAGEESISGTSDAVINQILMQSIIKVVPIENANGRLLVEKGYLCERRNGRGVDTNRNWDIDWGKKEKDYDPAEEYPGTAPFSEPESRILQDEAKSFKPHLWVNVHSGMQAMFMPYDHNNSTPEADDGRAMERLLRVLNSIHCSNQCTVGSGGGSVGYFAHGTATDYMYGALKVPIAYTFEIYGDSAAERDDCFKMFNPIDELMFERVVYNWSFAFITLLENVPAALTEIQSKKRRKMMMMMSRKVKVFVWDGIDGHVHDMSVLRLHFLLSLLVVCIICFKLLRRVPCIS